MKAKCAKEMLRDTIGYVDGTRKLSSKVDVQE